MVKKNQNYKVLIPCRNDKTRKRYKVGQEVTTAELKVANDVIQNWIDIGVLEIIEMEVNEDGDGQE